MRGDMKGLIHAHRQMVEQLRREIATSRALKSSLRAEMNKLRAEVRRIRTNP
jgi:hypothetical protein